MRFREADKFHVLYRALHVYIHEMLRFILNEKLRQFRVFSHRWKKMRPHRYIVPEFPPLN